MADLKESELDDIDFAYQTYLDGTKKQLDSTELGSVLRALNLNPSLASLEKLGASKKKGEKFFTLEEVQNAYKESRKEKKDQGCYEDFVECLKLYDKNENGKMLLAELSHSLLSLGEKLSDPEVDIVFKDCLPEEDDEGEIEYDIFLRKMCDRPPK